jgi:hypothetical protein
MLQRAKSQLRSRAPNPTLHLPEFEPLGRVRTGARVPLRRAGPTHCYGGGAEFQQIGEQDNLALVVGIPDGDTAQQLRVAGLGWGGR